MRHAIIVIRHAEALKNVGNQFGSTEGDEPLTPAGRKGAADALHGPLSGVFENQSVEVYSSPTVRCLETARVFQADCRPVPITELAPIISPFAGLSEREAATLDPTFMRAIEDYRIGLRSAYSIARFPGEEVRSFEERTMRGFEKVILSEAPTAVLVGHQSTITAILLAAARACFSYPIDWYGHITVPLLGAYRVEVEDSVIVGLEALASRRLE